MFASGVGVHWYACYMMARREKKVHARLQERGIESFLPVVPRISQWHDRRKRIEWPLLPGYVFARCESAGLQSVLEVPGVAWLVESNGRPARIRDEEIESVARFASVLARSGMVPPPPVPFEPGQRVRVVSGPFAGVEGVVLERRGRRRILVGLSGIGLGFEVDVGADTLKLLS